MDIYQYPTWEEYNDRLSVPSHDYEQTQDQADMQMGRNYLIIAAALMIWTDVAVVKVMVTKYYSLLFINITIITIRKYRIN